uniref:Uncharacterized protein n=1 Tax=Pristionchus pacificus TaxID=54126 RepID=A0A2A6CTT1_PRIPA|eukprot:PDM81595.1 hypothetical protein PRIPAC_30576 [Pristionchus pacificus]
MTAVLLSPLFSPREENPRVVPNPLIPKESRIRRRDSPIFDVVDVEPPESTERGRGQLEREEKEKVKPDAHIQSKTEQRQKAEIGRNLWLLELE